MNHHVINTRADLDRLANEDPAAYADFMARLKTSLTRNEDRAEYPENYDRTLKADDKGYVAPKLVKVSEDSTARRFGYTAAELAAALPSEPDI